MAEINCLYGLRMARVGGQALSRGSLLDFMERLEAGDRISAVSAVSMPLRQMSNAEVVDYQLELKLAAEGSRST